MTSRFCLLACLLLLLPLAAFAQDDTATTTDDAATHGGWTGSGEFGFAAARGNSHTENLNAKLGLSQENELWKNSFTLTGLRSKGDVTVVDANGEPITQFSTTANRYEGGASVGYKFDPRSYLVSALRYEHDDFGANVWQGIVSVGYGYIALKNARTELSFEIGPGYKRYQPAGYYIDYDDGTSVWIKPPVEHEIVARGLINWKHQLTANTKLEDTVLLEAGSKNKYYQNDAGLAVSMTEKLALKLGYQVRYNSNTQPGTMSTDQLYTTNLVYNF
jgi:putative salt-induced outer membrane protein